MAIFNKNLIRVSTLIRAKSALLCIKGSDKRFIMATHMKLEKALEDLERNPYFEKYANKIARLQETSPKEFLQQMESQETKARKQKVRICSMRPSACWSLWMFPFLLRNVLPLHKETRRSKHSFCASRKAYITTPIFYVNAGPHIGHTYTAVLADAMARFNSMLGQTVILTTGTDEYGTKVEKAAKSAALPTPEYCNEISLQFKNMCDKFQVEYSSFIRTTEERHREAVQHFWNCLEKGGHIYLGKYSGWYNVSDEAFVSETEIAQKSPTNPNEAFTVSGDVVDWMEEDTYKFKLTSLKGDLQYWLKDESVIQPAMYRNTLLSWLDDLQDLSVSRPSKRVPWAIPTPSDKSHTIYVWLDALVNYLTAVGYPDHKFKDFWPPTLQIIGKDILKFHGIYWPAFLMAAGLEPPKKLLCHGHWMVDDQKMSKSKGNVISPFEAANNFTEDGLRYFLLRQAVLHADANYNALKVENILNSELAHTLGNLINRCFGSTINPDRRIYSSSEYKTVLQSEVAVQNITALEELEEKTRVNYEECHLHHAIDSVIHMLHLANGMFEHHQPWHLSKLEDAASTKELEAVISLALENIRVAALVLYPVIPRLTSDLLDFLEVPKKNRMWQDASPLHVTHAATKTRYVSSRNMMFFKKIRN